MTGLAKDRGRSGRRLQEDEGFRQQLCAKPTGIYFTEGQKPFLKHLAVDLDTNVSALMRALVSRFQDSYEQAGEEGFEPIDVQEVLDTFLVDGRR